MPVQRLPFLLMISLFLCTFTVCAQDQKEADFKKTCDALLQSMAKKKLSGVNSLVNPAYGVYVLHRQGVFDQFQNLTKLGSDVYFSIDYFDITAADLKKYSLKYGKLPSYDCDESVWSKRGFTADSAKKYKPVSEVVASQLKYNEIKTSRKEKATIKFMEQFSRKVIFTGSKGDGIIFFLMYTNGKWWLSIIDRVTTDCSA